MFTRGAPKPDADPSLSEQVDERLANGVGKDAHYEGSDLVVSTGSTLLDLAISGGRFERGGIPGGILVEIFGPNSSGKTVLLCEIAGAVQRAGGQVMFRDPEARLNQQFAKLFGFQVENALYDTPDTVAQLFDPIKKWKPEADDVVNGVFADSLAALSTEMEMDDNDKYGMRRAKEFSEQCRRTCRVLAQRNLLMVCSNQVRQNLDAGPFGEKFKSPGGEAIGFYSSLRLRCHSPRRINRERQIAGKDQKRVVGVETLVEVYKNSVWEPFHSAPLYILYDYGIDDIQSNLNFLKIATGSSSYMLGEEKLGVAIERAIRKVEERGLEARLRELTIQTWHEVEGKFKVSRRAKGRD